MSLPIRTTIQDAQRVCGYLATKPIGATHIEAKAVLDSKVLDGRKLSAYRLWGFMEDIEGRLKITELGRLLVKDGGVSKSQACKTSVANISPYRAIIERVVHRSETVLTAIEVASHWHEHFKSDASENEKILNDQAICFFHLAEGADLGTLVVGRKGQQTRFEFDKNNCEEFSGGSEDLQREDGNSSHLNDDLSFPPIDDEENLPKFKVQDDLESINNSRANNNRVFITHGKNLKILAQVKELVAYGKFEPVVSMEKETLAKAVTDKVLDDMRSCSAAVIHVGTDEVLVNENGESVSRINENVLIEIGAALALYGRNFILLVENGVSLPSNLTGLYECRYSGDELNMPATMKILKAFNEFK